MRYPHALRLALRTERLLRTPKLLGSSCWLRLLALANNAGELQRTIGGYPPKSGWSHSMPSCCKASRDELDATRDLITHEIESGQAPAATIGHILPG